MVKCGQKIFLVYYSKEYKLICVPCLMINLIFLLNFIEIGYGIEPIGQK
jgi:hypothetical protein